MAAYQLSIYGQAVGWLTWRSIGGCGLPTNTGAYRELGPMSQWPKGITLGDIADVCPHTGRSLAYFAVERLDIKAMGEAYKP